MNAGISPSFTMGATVVENVKIGVITSEPFGKFNDSRAKRFAEDPEFTYTPYFFPNKEEILFSNSDAFLPATIMGVFRTSITALTSFSPNTGKAYGTLMFFFIL